MVLTSFMVFLSTPSARRATRCGRPDGLSAAISIHALREEGDISSRPLMIPNNKFLSTPSARRATLRARTRARDQLISIHALREEGDAVRGRSTARCSNFYPRPPRGGRHFRLVDVAPSCIFLSTPSARRATTPTLGFAT